MLSRRGRIHSEALVSIVLSIQSNSQPLSRTVSKRRSVRLRRRPDLVCQALQFGGDDCWVVKDPVSLKYFRVKPPEWCVLEQLDGSTSYAQILDRLQSEFPEQNYRLSDVQSLVSSFHGNGLLLSDNVGQTAPLRARRKKELQQKSLQLLMSAMSLKFPGVDPERFLNWLYPKVRWLFSGTATAIFLLICVAALLLVGQNLTEMYRRLPDFESFFGVNNLVLMATVLIATKSLHELGHGLMCKHFGGECHEIGFMLLVMTPAMYCNTSDSWRLPNKWHRILIGAAGMYVEVVAAAICVFVWWYTQPGTIHYLALNVVFLCGVSTIIFNANPLLRYDGYYMLADYLEIPNMGQKSKLALLSKLRQWCLGMDPVNPSQLPQRNQTAFAIYSVASFVYRWFVMIVIFWFLINFFKPYGLEAIGHVLVGISLVGLVVVPLFKVSKFMMFPGRMRKVKPIRFLASVCTIGILGFALFWIPFPIRSTAHFVIEPIDAQKVYVNQPGLISNVYFRPGDKIKSGQTIATLANEDLMLSIAAIEASQARIAAELESYRLQENQIADASRKINSAIVQKNEMERRLTILKKMADQLSLTANRDGTIIAAPNVPPPTGQSERTLATWNGTPLDDPNEDCHLEKQTLVCLVGDPDRLRARLFVNESDAKQVIAGQAVELMLDSNVGQTLTGKIEFVSRETVRSVPRELMQTNGGPIGTQSPTPDGTHPPLLTMYEASVVLPDSAGEILNGSRGVARISLAKKPLGQRILHYLRTTINFR